MLYILIEVQYIEHTGIQLLAVIQSWWCKSLGVCISRVFERARSAIVLLETLFCKERSRSLSTESGSEFFVNASRLYTFALPLRECYIERFGSVRNVAEFASGIGSTFKCIVWPPHLRLVSLSFLLISPMSCVCHAFGLTSQRGGGITQCNRSHVHSQAQLSSHSVAFVPMFSVSECFESKMVK